MSTPKKTVSEKIIDSFAEKIIADESFNGISVKLVNAIKVKQPKAKIKAIMRETNEASKP